MADFRIYIKQERGTAQWGNTFNITATDEAEAASRGAAIAALLATRVWSGVNFTGVRVSTRAQDGRTGRTYPLSVVGALTFTNPLPFFNVGRLLFYPGVKQNGSTALRYCLDAASQIDGQIQSAVTAALTQLADNIKDLGYVCNTAWAPYTASGMDPRVGMQQGYRAWAARAGVDEGD